LDPEIPAATSNIRQIAHPGSEVPFRVSWCLSKI
jgi:hypothetical protein